MTGRVSVAVASRSFSRHPILRAELVARHPDATFNDEGKSFDGDALVGFLRGHERAILGLERIDDGVLAAVPELRVVSKYGVGLDSLDVRAMQARGVRLGWRPGVNRRSLAELTIAAAIALLHRVPGASHDLRQGTWRAVVGRELSGSTVGIIGCGHVGREVAVLARAFDCRVLAYDVADLSEFCRTYGIQAADLPTLLRESDVVTIHATLNDATRRLLDADRLAQMRADAVLINTARGGIVDEAALYDMLRSGRLAGAALDVFENEPPTDRRLIDLPNVIATPHIGSSTEQSILAMGRAAIDGLDTARLPAELGLC